jgi:outer membrane biosynthesis protein TonB
MRTPRIRLLRRLGAALALAAALAACTKGGQFDPTTLLDNDMFNNKKPLQGQREQVFPNGVPGATTGIPADLYKGYQPPPQAADNGEGAMPISPTFGAQPQPQAQEAEAKPKPKPKPKAKPKPKIARAPAPPRTEISVGLAKKPKPAAQQQGAQPTQTDWPAPPPTQSSQTVWPAPPPTTQSQPSQSIWPNPPPTGTSSQ